MPMSIEEQDAVAGRLVREYAGLGKELAALLAEVDRFAEAFKILLRYLNSRTREIGGARFGTPTTAIDDIPTADTLRDICTQVASIVERRKVIHASLKALGLEPKDPPVPV